MPAKRKRNEISKGQPTIIQGINSLNRLHQKQQTLKNNLKLTISTSNVILIDSDNEAPEEPELDHAKRNLFSEDTPDVNPPDVTPLDSDCDSDKTVIITPVTTPTKRSADETVMITPVTTPTRRSAFDLLRSPSKTPPTSPGSQGSSPRKRVVSPRTYLRVVRELFEPVLAGPSDVLEDEKEFAEIFTNRTDGTFQFCCLKLFLWKPKWYNVCKFCEKTRLELPEVEVDRLYASLKRRGVVDTDYTKEDIGELLSFLDKNAVRDIYQKFKMNKKVSSKEEMTKNILAYCRNQSTLGMSPSELIMKEIGKKMGRCIRVSTAFREAFFRVYLLATFTNANFLDIGQFFGRGLGLKVTYPRYEVEEYPVFRSREEFLGFCHGRKLMMEFEDAMTSKNHTLCRDICLEAYGELQKLDSSSVRDDSLRVDLPHLRRFTARSAYSSILTTASKHHSAKFPTEVRDWLEHLIRTVPDSHRVGVWCYHLSWLYMRHVKPIDNCKAAELISGVLERSTDRLSEVQLHDLRHRAGQLKGKIDDERYRELEGRLPGAVDSKEIPEAVVDARALRGNASGSKRSYVVQGPGGEKSYMSVENIALEHYLNKCGYTDGRHCEGQLILVTFTLFFWNVIYSPREPVPATFLSKLQEVPLDFYGPHFYLNRKEEVDRRLEEIASSWSDDEVTNFLNDSYDAHRSESGVCCVGDYLQESEKDLLGVLVICIGRGVLAKIFERLVRNVRLYRSGLPDLIVWNAEKRISKFVEVKGENDRLSVKQHLWLGYLRSIGAETEVCHVHSMGSKRRKLWRDSSSKSSNSTEGTQET